ncbi:ABC transporter ATP-binding protein [Saccharomonospora xinjiangensis]|uniref:ABC-type multidrug transport system, ATPase component n=1 Tax=Saccharomonospora xinjiangensis XJ-54 TaxID=882086 RepID=I0V6N1_9PSEU|nr:ABC transporter ATP-binding protein [Saccharomonospora xinjiangensis]EID55784.1 ABC-type multidrug transport system, ATPase component [Saccharomonospora xinjiangensis XJ-54]
MPEQTVIDVHGLHKRYGDTVAIDDVSFTVERGEIFGIVGPNGAGKTTTVECVAGLRVPDGGTVRVLGHDPGRNPAELRQRLGVQLQSSRLPDRIKVGEALRLYSSFYRDPADIGELLDLFGLTERHHTAFSKLSGGQQQRVSIALALIGTPEVVIFDELTTGLDPHARRDVWSLVERIRDSGVTVVLVTHYMEEAERLCDRLAIIDSGRVVATDTPARLVATAEAGQRVRFRPSEPLDDGLVLALPEVLAVERQGSQVVVSGTNDVLHAVTSLLARRHIIAHDLRVSQTTLDDVFVSLTGRPLESTEEG